MPNTQDLARLIDHTLLRLEATEAEVVALCREAREHGFYSVCVRPNWVALAARELEGSRSIPITVVSFPSGDAPTESKAAETRAAVADGAREVDMVLNRHWLRQRELERVWKDVRAVVDAAGGVPVKVILETSELTDPEKWMACALVKSAGAQFVKTSTGFSKGGATAADVKLMREAVGPEFGVKASGGIRTTQDAEAMVAAGANRLGCSASIAIVQGGKASGGGY